MNITEAQARDTGAALAFYSEVKRFEIAWAITKAAKSFPEFSSDEVWGILNENGTYELAHPNAIGAAFLTASKLGVIKATGRVRKSIRPGSHRRNVQVWFSLILKGDK